MEEGKKDVLGTVKISDEVVIICCTNAVLKTEGVYKLTDGFMGNLQKNLLGQRSPFSGIKLNREDDTVSVDIYIIVDFDVKIPQVAWDVQVNVKKELEEITGLKVNSVNIHVQGVRTNEPEEEND